MFGELRRALLLRDDKAHFDEMWNKAEFHVPAAEKAKHPLPITSILLCINLEQEKAIYKLEGRILAQQQQLQSLEERLNIVETKNIYLKGEIDNVLSEMELFRKNLREELIEIVYPSYVS